jgi:lipopolysaccharide transport system permease protein
MFSESVQSSFEPSDGRPEPSGAGNRRRRIECRTGWTGLDLRELWFFRELLLFRAQRDLKVRYKQTFFGAAWAVFQPLATMVVFTVFFGRLAGLEKQSVVAYPVAVFCALLPWQLFAYCLTQSSNSLVDNGHVLTKVYFPRLILPLSVLLCGLVDFLVSFAVLLLMMAWYGIMPGPQAALLPAFLLLAIAAALSVGLWLSALNVMYRDVRYVVPFVVQLWLFITPVAYPSELVPSEWQWVYGLNPMVGVIDGFRWALLGGPAPGTSTAASVVITAVLLTGGLFFFRRMERRFADLI